jgi:2-(1,2-epoxy-1,2-dihydrophenyl)acetyl-CoA isomerase
VTAAWTAGDVTVEVDQDHVGTVEFHRPPDNYFDVDLVTDIADALAWLDDQPEMRAVVLCSEGKNFCAGAALGGDGLTGQNKVANLYQEGVRIFSSRKPIVVAVQGAAVGGGLGLALTGDFRVGTPESRLTANFARLGFHQGFGLSVTLPPIVGQQRALEMLYTGARLTGEQAHDWGLLDRLVPLVEVRDEAHRMAAHIAVSAPLSLLAIRHTMRGDLAGKVRAATAVEAAEQDKLRATADFAEGVKATADRRTPNFTGR